MRSTPFGLSDRLGTFPMAACSPVLDMWEKTVPVYAPVARSKGIKTRKRESIKSGNWSLKSVNMRPKPVKAINARSKLVKAVNPRPKSVKAVNAKLKPVKAVNRSRSSCISSNSCHDLSIDTEEDSTNQQIIIHPQVNRDKHIAQAHNIKTSNNPATL
ncbi:hypothetical protein CDL15_Pgr023831 [Punica granatum]|uniref:Uncharacterized protein n=1 Tax=Punica granatum TaxID=22663 RepID=A0A218VZX0_PUNGR|nr:hypothetical protein CDL15_Pgr023831 [Punica granatum]